MSNNAGCGCGKLNDYTSVQISVGCDVKISIHTGMVRSWALCWSLFMFCV